MKKTSFFNSLPFKLLVAVILGIIAGLILNRYSTNGISMAVLNITVTIKYILGQIITFCVPLIVLGFIAPSITAWQKCFADAGGCGCPRLRLLCWRGAFFYGLRLSDHSTSVHPFLCCRTEAAAGGDL